MRVPRPLARAETLQLRRFIDVDERHFQLVDVGAVIVLGVRDSRLEHLAHEIRALLGHVLQRVDGVADRLAAHDVGHESTFLRGNMRVAQL